MQAVAGYVSVLPVRELAEDVRVHLCSGRYIASTSPASVWKLVRVGVAGETVAGQSSLLRMVHTRHLAVAAGENFRS